MSVPAFRYATLLGLALLCMAPARAATPLPSERIARAAVPLERQLDGTVEAVQHGTIAAETSGRVVEVLYDIDDVMPAGAVIVRLRGVEQRAGLARAEAELAEASSRRAEAQQQFERIAGLLERRLVSRQHFDQASADRDAAVARAAAAEAALAAAREGVRHTEVRAPWAGVVARRYVEAGEAVQPGTPLLSALSLRELRVSADLPRSLAATVRARRRAAVYAGDRRIEATRVTLAPQAAPDSETFRVRLELPAETPDLYPGMLVKAAFVVGESERLTIPAAALVERGELRSVYVQGDDGRVRLRQVRIGQRFGDRLEVLAGLNSGERVVTDPPAALQHLRTTNEPPAGAVRR
ncbi:MAG: efflux RND transporter periplasmic adaptor subunit [Gammaproteobacteria bacterium]|nr:efflux RND transporter periplasmic adaptor subunit [Gammaproteobacteria bacterium]